MIDFNDKMEKSNFSYITRLIKRKEFSEEERISTLKDVIEIHEKYSNFKKKYIDIIQKV